MKRNVGYEISFTNNTITMNYKFAAAASVYGTTEYKTLLAIKSDFPQLKEIVKAGRTNKSGRSHNYKNLTYNNIKLYITQQPNSEKLLETFEAVKVSSKAMASPYQFVVDWFKEQFPDYKKACIFKIAEHKTESANGNPSADGSEKKAA